MENVEKLAAFNGKINSKPENHTGYCGIDREEDFSDLEFGELFIVLSKDNHITAALGLDTDVQGRLAEIWGLFILEPESWFEHVSSLWELPSVFKRRCGQDLLLNHVIIWHQVRT